MWFAFFIFWFFLCVLVAVFAESKGRSSAGFFFLSLFLSPLIGFLTALVTEPDKSVVEARQLRDGDSKRCPYCAELIKVEAVICRYCGKEQVAATEPEPEPTPPEPDPEPEPDPQPDKPLRAARYGPRPRNRRAPTSLWVKAIWGAVIAVAAIFVVTVLANL